MNLADKAVAFLNNLTLIGDYSGQQWELRDWQEDIVRQIFQEKSAGQLKHKECFLYLPRK